MGTSCCAIGMPIHAVSPPAHLGGGVGMLAGPGQDFRCDKALVHKCRLALQAVIKGRAPVGSFVPPGTSSPLLSNSSNKASAVSCPPLSQNYLCCQANNAQSRQRPACRSSFAQPEPLWGKNRPRGLLQPPAAAWEQSPAPAAWSGLGWRRPLGCGLPLCCWLPTHGTKQGTSVHLKGAAHEAGECTQGTGSMAPTGAMQSTQLGSRCAGSRVVVVADDVPAAQGGAIS